MFSFWITGLTLSSQLELLLNIHRPVETFSWLSVQREVHKTYSEFLQQHAWRLSTLTCYHPRCRMQPTLGDVPLCSQCQMRGDCVERYEYSSLPGMATILYNCANPSIYDLLWKIPCRIFFDTVLGWVALNQLNLQLLCINCFYLFIYLLVTQYCRTLHIGCCLDNIVNWITWLCLSGVELKSAKLQATQSLATWNES